MIIRPAEAKDLPGVEAVYEDVHREEAAGRVVTGWLKGVYPVRSTAEAALERGDLFVLEDEAGIAGTAIINQIQVDVYEGAKWEYPAPEEEVMVLHTLVIASRTGGKGYGKAFIRYYEDFAAEHGCPCLRIDTNARNSRARKMYAGQGYKEIGIVPTVFNGIPGVDLVLLEKHLEL